jgi:hypothetical protein
MSTPAVPAPHARAGADRHRRPSGRDRAKEVARPQALDVELNLKRRLRKMPHTVRVGHEDLNCPSSMGTAATARGGACAPCRAEPRPLQTSHVEPNFTRRASPCAASASPAAAPAPPSSRAPADAQLPRTSVNLHISICTYMDLDIIYKRIWSKYTAIYVLCVYACIYVYARTVCMYVYVCIS